MNATIASAVRTGSPADRAERRYFYVSIATVLALIIFVGFTPTYWARLAQGSANLHPATHLHAALFFLWTLLFVGQTVLAARGRLAWHRELGMFGLALAGAMLISGIMAMVATANAAIGTPREGVARVTTALSAGALIMFVTFMTLAIANLRAGDRHKRYMVLVMFSMLQAAVARMIMLVPSIDQSQRILLGAIFVDLLLLAIIAADARARGRVHPVYIGGAAFILSIQYLRRAVVETEWWGSFYYWLGGLAM